MGIKFVLQVEKVLDWLHNSANRLALLFVYHENVQVGKFCYISHLEILLK